MRGYDNYAQAIKPASHVKRIVRLAAVLPALASGAALTPTENIKMYGPDQEQAVALMTDFAERTGLTSGKPARRYLWTDAFAVCNFLGLSRSTGNDGYAQLAFQLVDQVHHTLGRHREDDSRSGWISGLGDAEGERQPTRGGLRIGKRLPERRPEEPFVERLEWDRDGQYFHYLTKWMHALDQAARASGQSRYNTWGRELAVAAHHAFIYSVGPDRPRRMYWKMSIDLERPAVPSMGQHDPLDGYITLVQLRSTATRLGELSGKPDLAAQIPDFAAMTERDEWATADPLGLGGLLNDAFRVMQLRRESEFRDDQLLETLLTASLAGLQYFTRSNDLKLPAEHRLAFRELGLVIGLEAAQLMRQAIDEAPFQSSRSARLRGLLDALSDYLGLRDGIAAFWRNPKNRLNETWSEHRDINEVMLATALAPGGFLILRPPEPSAPPSQLAP